MIIGITGTNGAGKTTAIQMLKSSGFHELSLSDYLREEAKRRGFAHEDRTVLRELGNELRAQHGPGYLMEQVLRNIKRPLDSYVIDSIRNPAEALALKTAAQETMFIGVDARPEIRYKRIAHRVNTTARREAAKTYEEFVADEETENMSDAFGQQIRATLDAAEIIFYNNGTPEELEYKLSQHLNRISTAHPTKLSWPEYFMSIAKLVSQRSSCLKRRVGAVIVKDNQILCAGYNGTPKGTPNCNDGGCARCSDSNVQSGQQLGECLCVHAEENAFLQAASNGVSIKNAEIYTTTQPCLGCTKLIANSGIVKVYYGESYPNPKGSALLEMVHIPLVQQKWR